MNLKQVTCKNCGSDLDIDVENKLCVCPFCGNRYVITNTNTMQIVSEEEYESSKYHNTGKAKMIVLLIVALSCLLMVAFVNFSGEIKTFIQSIQKVSIENEDKQQETYRQNILENIVEETRVTQQSTENITPKYQEFPSSELVVAAVEHIFGKDIDMISKEEINSFKYLDIDYDMGEGLIYFMYSFEDYQTCEDFDSTILGLTFEADIMDYRNYYYDLNCFRGLTKLNTYYYNTSDLLQSNAQINGSLDVLENLNCFSTVGNVNVSQLAELVNTSKLKHIILNSVDNLEGIEKFDGLECLELIGCNEEDIAPLSKCESLKILIVDSNTKLENYKPLGDIPNLEILYVDFYNEVKNLDFLGKLTKLSDLTIVGSMVNKLDFLSLLTNLSYLRLEDNRGLKDYSALGSLDSLEELDLHIGYANGAQMDLSGLKNLTGLKSLTTHYVYDIEFLEHLTNLEYLNLDYCFNFDLPNYLVKLKALDTLVITNLISQFDDKFECLSQLPNLKYLDLSQNNFEREIDGVFNLPNIEYLSLNKSSFYIAPENIKVFDNLKALDLSQVRINDYVLTYDPSYEKVSKYGVTFQQIFEAFCKSPNIENLSIYYDEIESLSPIANLKNLVMFDIDSCELSEISKDTFKNNIKLENIYLGNNTIDDLSFVEGLTNLEIIDINNNYVTDLTPLKDCKSLEAVFAYGNPIEDYDVLGDVIVMH